MSKEWIIYYARDWLFNKNSIWEFQNKDISKLK